jgi:peptidyl-prolyl cis-trans isomerase D
MFDFVRKHTKAMQLMLFILIVPSFVLFGLEGYNRFREKGEAVAKVDGREITQADWDNAHRAEVDRLRQQMPNLDAKMFDSEEARYGTLQKLVRDHVLAAAVEHEHLMVGDQRLARELQSNQLISSLRGPDGKLDVERYRQLLAAQGMTPEMYENQVRTGIATQQVLAGVQGSGFTPAVQADVALGSFFQKREVQVARFNAADYVAKVQPTDADLDAYYKANPKLFQAPEQATIEYLLLDLAAVQKGITVPEQDLKTYYEQNASRLGGAEERRASHILINAQKTASAEEKAKAKARAEELLAQVKKNPDSFADVAKKDSQDPGSAAQGGDLDFFARGAMTKPFEDAVFGMKQKGEIVGPVESEFGYHIIKLTDMKVPVRKTFEEVRPQLEADLSKQQAQKRYAELAETFTNTVYEQADSLKPAAEKLKLEIRTAPGVSRTPMPGAAGALANAKFLQAVFSPESVERKRNTEAMEIGANQMVSGRIAQYSPARTRPLAEVRDQVRQAVVAERAAAMARKEGEEKLAAWKATPASATLPAAEVISRQDAGKQPRPVVEAALRGEAGALQGVSLGAEGYAIVKVVKVVPREAPAAAQAQQEVQQYTRAWSTAEALAYYENLQKRYKVQINAPKPKEATLVQ